MIIDFHQAKALLLSGDVVALPTETVYGLAARFDNKEAIQKVFSLKKRPQDNPLIIHLGEKEAIKPFLIEKDQELFHLIEAFWPGPLTIVAPVKTERILSLVRSGLTTAAFRMPSHAITQELIRQTRPLIMPSANLSGRPTATKVKHVVKDFGADLPIIDGGFSENGLESTVIVKKDNRWQIARAGCILEEDIAQILGYKPSTYYFHKPKDVISPGMKYRHYSPQAKLSLFKEKKDFSKEVVVGFSDRVYRGALKVYHLGLSTDPKEISRNLYDILRQLDEDNISKASVDICFSESGIFKTILERLEKASQETY